MPSKMLSLVNLTKQKSPKISWRKIAEKALNKNYDLSVVLSGNRLMRRLNRVYRGENKSASVLSFSLSKKQGEIFINLSRKEHSPFYLFIHAICHLKNFEHGDKMKEQEKKLSEFARNLKR